MVQCKYGTITIIRSDDSIALGVALSIDQHLLDDLCEVEDEERKHGEKCDPNHLIMSNTAQTTMHQPQRTHIVLEVLCGLAHALDVLAHGHRHQRGRRAARGVAARSLDARLVALLHQLL